MGTSRFTTKAAFTPGLTLQHPSNGQRPSPFIPGGIQLFHFFLLVSVHYDIDHIGWRWVMVICKKKIQRAQCTAHTAQRSKDPQFHRSTGPRQARKQRRGKGPRVHRSKVEGAGVHESTAAKGQRSTSPRQRRGKGSTVEGAKIHRSTVHGRQRGNEGAKVHESTGPRGRGPHRQEGSRISRADGAQVHKSARRKGGAAKGIHGTGRKEGAIGRVVKTNLRK